VKIEEMRNHGVDPRTRGARLDAQLAALKEIWSRERAEFHGGQIGFDPIFQWPKPTRPRVYVGGNSAAALARAVAATDGWMPNALSGVESVEIQLDRVRQLAGRDFPVTATQLCPAAGPGKSPSALSRPDQPAYKPLPIRIVSFRPAEDSFRASAPLEQGVV
jgi:alkanesulfonate monooxygenase SsuD/methylene tetrahydromethanopterin reductase-like flavin-dependent oxidoreductase (luciferase family)